MFHKARLANPLLDFDLPGRQCSLLLTARFDELAESLGSSWAHRRNSASCSFQSLGNGLSSVASSSPSGCVPDNIASVIEGERSVSRRTRPRYASLIFSAFARSRRDANSLDSNMPRQRWARAKAFMIVLSILGGGGDHGSRFAGVTTCLRPPWRRSEIGMLTTTVRPSRLSLGRPHEPTVIVSTFITRLLVGRWRLT